MDSSISSWSALPAGGLKLLTRLWVNFTAACPFADGTTMGRSEMSFRVPSRPEVMGYYGRKPAMARVLSIDVYCRRPATNDATVTENHGVGGSIPPLGTKISDA